MLISVYGRSANSCRGHGGHSLPVNVTVTGTVQNYSDTGPLGASDRNKSGKKIVLRCNGNTRLVGSQGSTETYPSTTRTCITRLGYFPS